LTLQVVKVKGISATEFCANMAKKWQKLTAKTGGNLYNKTFVPFRKEGELGDGIMTVKVSSISRVVEGSTVLQNLLFY
jgi:hypothetical protein